MKILVFSDSHGYYNRMLKIINSYTDVDAVIHCGDILNDCISLEKLIDSNIKLFYVCGNNDIAPEVPKQLELVFEDKRIFVTHGHLFGVKAGLDSLRQKIKEGFDLVLYGHTHRPDTEYFGSGILLNPGAVCYSSKGTYAVITIQDGKLNTTMERI